ncbi:unnamed protein product [Cuscuta campestris]|uniref:Uncharacterized protein n=1 Tax=Cuscuta campestris TaxID=132261 RepID=A0A484MVI4_9ASTE|nr:unnamed protein product [Cuscuta campestris]
MSKNEDSQNVSVHSYDSGTWSQASDSPSSSSSSESSQRPASPKQVKPVDAATAAHSSSAAQTVTVARTVKEGYVWQKSD